MRERRYGFGRIPTGGSVEIEENGHEPPRAQAAPKGAKNDLSLWRKTTEQQDGLRRERVDNIPDFGVLQQQVEKLRDLKVIGPQRGIAGRRNQQVLLERVRQIGVPYRDAVDGTFDQLRTCELRVHEDRALEIGGGEIGARQVSASKVCVG